MKSLLSRPFSVVIIESPSANLTSLRFALERLQPERPFELSVTADPEKIAAADRVFLPGVGHAGYVMDALEQKGLTGLIRTLRKPLMGICVGMQILFEELTEGDVRAGIGLLPGRVEPLRPALDKAGLNPSEFPVPHMGWNLVSSNSGEPLGHAYFVHSYYHPPGPNTAATSSYGVPIAAVVRRGPIWGCQFHPEKSGSFGARILQDFLNS